MVEGSTSVGYKAGTEPENRKLLKSGTTKQGSRGLREPTKDWRVGTGLITWDLRGSLNMEPMVDNVRPYAVAIAEMPQY